MLYHGTSLVVGGKGFLIRGKPGSGKSDLALRLIHRGATLIADDQTEITCKDHRLILTPPEALKGKLEVRGIGIIEVPFCPSQTLNCVIDLRPYQDIERLPEDVFQEIEGIKIRSYEIDPFEVSAVEKVLTLRGLLF